MKMSYRMAQKSAKAGNSKSKIPNSKQIRIPKSEILRSKVLDFGFWPCLEFGILDLEFLPLHRLLDDLA
jgi:hypothetical protein